MSFSASRLNALKARVRDIGARAMYVRDVADIEWVTGFEEVFDEERAHAAFVPAGSEGVQLHTDSRYVTAMLREADGTPVAVDAEACKMSDWARKCWDDLSSDGSMAIEDSISLFEYRELLKAFDRYVDSAPRLDETHDLILELRAAKDAYEIGLMKAAQAITDAAFSFILDRIEPGVTERQLQLELDDYMLTHGASGLAFPTIIASGPNGASPHAIVSDRKLEVGECVVMDFGAKRAGYCSDMTRTIFLGQPRGEMLDAWETMRRANEEVQAMLRPGVTGREAHELAEHVLEACGFGGRMGHGLGHGVGLRVHELPVLSSRNDKPLMPGNVVTVEPGIYIPGRFGMRLEDYGVITESGFDRFTQSTHDLIVL